MLPSPGYLLFSLALFLEVSIDDYPPKDEQQDLLLKAWDKKGVRYSCWGLVGLCGLYFYDATSTLASAPVWMYTCEQRELLFYTERNAYTTGMFVFLFLVLRRLLDIQQQLFTMRKTMKAEAGPKKIE